MEHKNRCKRRCREGDSTCLSKPLTYSFNFITFVSMLPIPPSGHLDLFTMRGLCAEVATDLMRMTDSISLLTFRSTLVRDGVAIHLRSSVGTCPVPCPSCQQGLLQIAQLRMESSRHRTCQAYTWTSRAGTAAENEFVS